MHQSGESTTEYWHHIAIWYGRDSFPMSPTGVHPGNHFGEIEEALRQLAEGSGLPIRRRQGYPLTIVYHE